MYSDSHTGPLNDGNETPLTTPNVVRLSDVAPEKVMWLWQNKIPLGKVTLLSGNPGLGKSFVTMDIAARVSAGIPWPDSPDEPREPGGVVLLAVEDGLGDTIRPRLDVHQADCTRISAVQSVRVQTENGQPSRDLAVDLSRNIEALEIAIKNVDSCRLVVIDPITGYLDSINAQDNGEVRGVMMKLAALAERTGVAVLAVSHLRKSEGLAIHLTLGSIAFAAAARVAHAVVKDPDNPRRRLLLPIKNNLANDTGGLAYQLMETEVGEVAVVSWEPEPVMRDVDDVLAGSAQRRGPKPDARLEAMEWLKVKLADGPRLAKELFDESEGEGLNLTTLRRAAKDLGVKKPKTGEGWMWSLPQDDEATEKLETWSSCDDGADRLMEDSEEVQDDQVSSWDDPVW